MGSNIKRDMQKRHFYKLIIAIAMCELTGLAGSFFARPAIGDWYAGLVKSPLNPPDWVFVPVWTVLFALMGISFFLIWKSDFFIGPKEKRKGIAAFFIQLVLNVFWSVIFFGWRSSFSALVEIIFLWLAILATIVLFWRIRPIGRLAAGFLLPYFLWVTFAGYLNYSVWRLNAKDYRNLPAYDGSSEILSDFGNNQVEKAITNYLLTQDHFSWRTRDESHCFCAIENLKPEEKLFPLYVWVYCGEYIIQDGNLKTLSGSSGPAKIDYPNELSFYDLRRFSYEAPGDGSHYVEDIKKIFPEDIWQYIFDFNIKNIVKKIEETAFINISSWELIKQSVGDCEVKSVWQTHDREAGAEFKNGERLSAVESEIDDIIDLAVAAESKCGKILMGTE